MQKRKKKCRTSDMHLSTTSRPSVMGRQSTQPKNAADNVSIVNYTLSIFGVRSVFVHFSKTAFFFFDNLSFLITLAMPLILLDFTFTSGPPKKRGWFRNSKNTVRVKLLQVENKFEFFFSENNSLFNSTKETKLSFPDFFFLFEYQWKFISFVWSSFLQHNCSSYLTEHTFIVYK